MAVWEGGTAPGKCAPGAVARARRPRAKAGTRGYGTAVPGIVMPGRGVAGGGQQVSAGGNDRRFVSPRTPLSLAFAPLGRDWQGVLRAGGGRAWDCCVSGGSVSEHRRPEGRWARRIPAGRQVSAGENDRRFVSPRTPLSLAFGALDREWRKVLRAGGGAAGCCHARRKLHWGTGRRPPDPLSGANRHGRGCWRRREKGARAAQVETPCGRFRAGLCHREAAGWEMVSGASLPKHRNRNVAPTRRDTLPLPMPPPPVQNGRGAWVWPR